MSQQNLLATDTKNNINLIPHYNLILKATHTTQGELGTIMSVSHTCSKRIGHVKLGKWDLTENLARFQNKMESQQQLLGCQKI